MFEYWNPRIERMAVDDLHELQGKRLRSLVRYVHDHSSFYRQRFREAGAEPADINKLSDVTTLPITLKMDISNTHPTCMVCLSE